MTILRNSLKRIFGERKNIVFMIIVPILLNIFIISVVTKEAKYNIGILDNDSSQYTQEFIANLEKTCKVKLLTKDDDIKSMVVNKKLDCAFVFESGFTKDMISGKDVYIKSYSPAGTNLARPIQMYITSGISASKTIAKAAKGDADAFYKGMDNYHKNEYAVQYKDVASSVAKDVSKAVTSLGFIAFGMIFLLVFSTALILEDKLSGVYDRVLVTPLKRSSYFIQHFISCFIVSYIQVKILIDILPKIVNISYGKTDALQSEVEMVCLVFAVVCISIGIAISRFSKSTLMAGAIISLIDLPMLMLGGCMWPREIMSKPLQKVGDFMPTTWFLKAGEKVLYGKGIMAASNEIFYMLALAAFLLILSFVVKTDK